MGAENQECRPVAAPSPPSESGFRRQPRPAAALLLFAGALLAGLAPGPALAQGDTTFVSNLGQTYNFSASAGGTYRRAQGFTTGDNALGYTLSAVDLYAASGNSVVTPVVTVHQAASGQPGTLLYTLTPPTILRSGQLSFTAPAGATLAAGTDYFVVADGMGGSWSPVGTRSTNEDAGKASGWSIADTSYFSSDGGPWTESPPRHGNPSMYRIAVKGTLMSTAVQWTGSLSEAAANDGSVTGSVTARLTGDTFTAGVATGQNVTVSNVPSGLSASYALDSTRTVFTLTLTGMADAHANSDDVSDLTVAFGDGAFTDGTASTVPGSSKGDLKIDFTDAAGVTWAGNFTEALANDGTVTGSVTATLSGDTFTSGVATGQNVTVSNLPAGLSASYALNGARTVFTLTLTGAAQAQLDDVHDLTVAFGDDAFTNGTASTVAGSSRSDLTINFNAARSITWRGSFTETPANDGTVTGSVTATLTGDRFTTDVVSGGHFALGVDGSGALGVSVNLVRTSDTVVTVTLAGTATEHTDADDVHDMMIEFADGAFAHGSASTVVGKSKTDITIDFHDEAVVRWLDNLSEAPANDGTVTGSVAARLTGDTFTAGVATGQNVTVSNVPSGLSASYALDSARRVFTLTLTGTADAHANSDDVSDLTVTFGDGAFTFHAMASRVAESSRSNLKVDFTDNASLAWAGSFAEAAANDGSVTGSVTATLTGDTFTAGVAAGQNVIVSNVPSHLSMSYALNSDRTVLTLTLVKQNDYVNTYYWTEDVDLRVEFRNGAFTSGSPTAGGARDIWIDVNPALSVAWAGSFKEAPANDGTVTGSVTATLSGDAFVNELSATWGVTVSNVPAGLTAGVTRTSHTVFTLTLTGAATAHTDADDVSDLTVTFDDRAFFGVRDATAVAGSAKKDIAIDFTPAPNVRWTDSLSEASANDGSVTGSVIARLAGDTFTAGVATGQNVTVSNLPSGLGAGYALDGTGTVFTLTLTGTADAHANADDVSDLTVQFGDGAFTHQTASAVAGSSKSDLAIDFTDNAGLAWAGGFTEAAANDGTVTGSVTATLTGDTFTAGVATGENVTVTNVPSGLSASYALNGARTVFTLTLTGAAHVHLDDVSDLTVAFGDGAFTDGTASTVAGSSRGDLTIGFNDVRSITWAGSFAETPANDGTVTGSVTATLVGDSFTAGVATGENVTVENVPSGLSASYALNGARTVFTLTLTGAADAHRDEADVSDLTVTFADGAFASGSAPTGSTKGDFSIDFDPPRSISYAGSLAEAPANDGSVTGSITMTLSGDTFTAGVATGENVTVENVPSGLSASYALNGARTVLTLTLTGMADAHADSDDVSDLSVSFADGAFAGGGATTVTGSTKGDLAIDFDDTPDVTAPTLSTTTPPSVNGATLTLTYDEALDMGSVPAASVFSVKVGGAPTQLANTDPVTVSGSAVTLTLASPVAAGTTVTVTYTAGTKPIRDAAGNPAANLNDRAVTNNTPGVLLSASVLTLAEGGSGSYTVRLAAPPSASVTVTITSSNAEVTVDDTDGMTTGVQNTLTFTTGNWDAAQTVTVSADEDDDQAADSATLTHEIGGASEYDSLAEPTLTVTVNDNDSANSAPEYPADTAERSFDENAAPGTDIGEPLAATDADASDTLTYSLGGTDAASFDIDSGSGQLRTKSAVTYDFEAKSSYTVTVQVSDETDTDTVTVTITLNDVNEPPAFTTTTTAFEVAENTTAVGSAEAADPDADDATVTYVLGGTDSALFSISAAGVIAFDAAPDFETPGCGTRTDSNTCTLTVTASAGADTRAMSTPVRTITVTVTDVGPPAKPAAPTFGDTTSTTIVVNWLAPASPGSAITDYDVQYREGTTGGWTPHTHDGTALTATLASLNAGASYQVQVRATNGEGQSGWSDPGTATASDNNAPAFDAESYAFELAENDDGRTNAVDVGVVSATDPDGHAVSYRIAAGDGGGVFAIASDGAITYTGGGEDHETTPRFSLAVQATDTHNGSADVEVNVTVTDVNEPPAFDTEGLTLDASGTALFSVADDTTAVGPVTAVDPDAADTVVTYVLGGTDRDLFGISPSGVVAFLAQPDFESPRCGASGDSNECAFSVVASAGVGPRAMSSRTLDVKVTVIDAIDITPPALAATNPATVNGATLVLTYNEALDEDSVPAGSAFTVRVAGARAVLSRTNPVDVDDRAVTLTLASVVAHGDTVTVSYTAPRNNPVRDTVGNAAANLSNQAVSNITPEMTPPALAATNPTTVNGATLVLTYNEALDQGSVPAASAFTVSAAGSRVRVENVAIDDRAVTLTLASAVAHGDTVTVSYTAPATDPIRDVVGNAAANLSNQAVTNVTDDTTAPLLRTATITDEMLVMRYDEALDENSVPAASAFEVWVAGARVSVENVAIDGRAVRLTLASASAHGDTVSVYYAPSSTDPIRDLAGNAAAKVGHRVVTNNTPEPSDTTAPALRSATMTNATLVLAYNEALDQDSVPAASAFTVRVAGSTVTVTSVAVDGTKVKLTLASASAHGDAVTVSYAAPSANPIRDPAGNKAANLSSRAVTNDTPEQGDTTAPTLSSASITDDRITLTYDEPLDENSVPAASAFYVTTAGYSVKVDNVAIAGSTVTLTLRPSQMACGNGTVDYSVPGAYPIQDTSGNTAGRLADRAVTSVPNTPGITVTAPTPSPLPEGKSATFTVKLDAMPCGGVNLSLSSDDSYVTAPHHSVLSFNKVTGSGRWDRPQTVTVYSAQDHDAADETATFTLQVRDESPAEYRELADVAVTVEVADDDVAALSVADARVEEAAGATLDFAVTLDRARHVAVTVDYATSNGTAVAGQDYEAASGTLEFAPEETAKTVRVTVLDDAHNEGEETFTLRLTNPQGAILGDGEATGTIENSDPMPQAWLARFGRTAAVQVVEHVEERLQAPRQAGFQGRFAGRQLDRGLVDELAVEFFNRFAGRYGDGLDARMAGGDDRMTGGAESMCSSADRGLGAFHTPRLAGGAPMAMDPIAGMAATHGGLERRGRCGMDFGEGSLLTGSSFVLNHETNPGRVLSFWSRGAQSQFYGQEGDLSLDGQVRTAMLGADYARGPLVIGLSLAHTQGRGGYSGADIGEVISSVTGLYPWLGYQVTERTTVWGVTGYGRGALRLTPGEGAALESGLAMAMAAGGVRSDLVDSVVGGFGLALKADALWVGTGIAGVEGPEGSLAATQATVTRYRTALEASRGYSLKSRLSLQPSLEVGLRRDGGDAETGAGVDLGGGLIVSDTLIGLSADVRIRMLLAHQDKEFRERGVSMSFSFDPTPQTPMGFLVKVTPSWGGQATSGAEALWGRDTMAGTAHGGMLVGNRLEAELGYGLPVGNRLVGTPRFGVATSAYGRDYRLGYGLTVLQVGATSFDLGIDANRRAGAGTVSAEHGAQVRLTAHW